jgi:hypothetical protein
MSMTPERIAGLRKVAAKYRGETTARLTDGLDECLDALVALQLELDSALAAASIHAKEHRKVRKERDHYRDMLEHIASFTGDEDCTSQLVTMAKVALSKETIR